MPRKKCFRHIGLESESIFYKPAGIPLRLMDEVILEPDEYEAIRLADLEGIYQEQAAQLMKISRQTFGRIINTAHQKIADALINRKAIKIMGTDTQIPNQQNIENQLNLKK